MRVFLAAADCGDLIGAMTTQEDPSAGYDAIADQFVAARSSSGTELVRNWARSLASNSSIIDIGAGHGEPLTSALIDAGHSVWAIDASTRLVDAFKKRLPGVPIACETVEESDFFQRRFDAALMVGLIFLLPKDRQVVAFRNLSSVLLPGGRLLFSAPRQTGSWQDLLTKKTSWSLGEETYQNLLEQSGFSVIATHEDEGGSHYYEAQRQ